jgi:hypothetical protein
MQHDPDQPKSYPDVSSLSRIVSIDVHFTGYMLGTPPSATYFMLFRVQFEVSRFIQVTTRHLGTKGCLMD